MRNALSKRFVFLCEVVGYAIVFIVAGFAVYGLVTYKEVLYDIQGQPHFASSPIETEAPALFRDLKAESRTRVTRGENLLRYLKNPREMQNALVRQNLEEALRAAEKSPELNTPELITKIEDAQAQIPLEGEGHYYQADRDGLWYFPRQPDPDEIWPEGLLLGRVIALDSFTLTGSIARRDSEKIEPAMEARLSLEEGKMLLGQVSKLETGQDPSTVTLQFSNLSLEEQVAIEDWAVQSFSTESPALSVKILLGKRSLFRTIFGKK